MAARGAQIALAGRITTIVKAEPWIRLAATSVAGPGSASARPTYDQLRTAGIDTVLEVAITEIGFESCGPEAVRRLSAGCPQDPKRRLVDLFMSAQARLVRVLDGPEAAYNFSSPCGRFTADVDHLLSVRFALTRTFTMGRPLPCRESTDMG